MKGLLCLLGVLNTIQQVQGHGGIYNYSIGDVQYAGNYPWLLDQDQPETIQRRWFPDPIYDVNHPYLSCNRGNPVAGGTMRVPSLHAPIEAGSNITANYRFPACPPNAYRPTGPATQWEGEVTDPFQCDSQSWPWGHHSGPIIVYMAACNGPCQNFDPSFRPVWFKIYEAGFLPEMNCRLVGDTEKCSPTDLAGGFWYQREIVSRGHEWTVQIPKNLKPGNYLIRHEIINIETPPTAQFYPECAQLTVTGTGDKLPTSDYLAAFPGAYKVTDPGIFIATEFYGPLGHSTHNYTVPGPKLWTGEE